MKKFSLNSACVQAAIFLILTILLGLFVALLPLNGIEGNLVLDMQNLAQKTIGLQVFQILTYLGDFYLWIIFASVYLFHAYFKSRMLLDSAIELAIFLVITTVLTYFIKIVIARPRPYCTGLTVYESDLVESFSYPSGHVSRAVGAFLILSKGSRNKESLVIIAVFFVSLSRILLGAHYLTDVVGGIFLSLATQRLANRVALFLKSRSKKPRALSMNI